MILNLSSEDSKLALEFFITILKFGGDYPSSEANLDLCQSLILKGIEMMPLVRTEIYLQVLKQIHGCPNKARYIIAYPFEVIMS